MARTTRKYLTSRNHREARKGRPVERRRSGARTVTPAQMDALIRVFEV